MTRPQLKISVPQPCTESWAEMTPQAQGRFCASCATTVVDFSKFTDKQLLEYFTRKSGKTCGRFSATQLNREVYEEALPKPNFFPRALAAVALFLGISSQAQAQNIPDQPVPSSYIESNKNAVAEKTVAKAPEKVSGDSLVISGRVLDAETKEGLAFASVYIDEPKVGCLTDAEGNFKLSIPNDFSLDQHILKVAFIGYDSYEMLLNKDNIFQQKQIFLSSRITGLSEVEIDVSVVATMVGGINLRKTPSFYLRSFWWKTKNLFRKRNYDAIELEAE